ncbi:hypothetical protein [Candidatus Pelagibacter sp.]|uniref:hypothetical protein n=1 Tax=Candidatus Pelagibacter sp. TaxID=2024849 RepID=UPI003D12FBF1
MRKYKGARSIKSSSRKRSLGKVKVNYNFLVKKEIKDYLNVYGAKIKDEDPAKYYSMIGRKLPKKYLKEKKVITPVNAYVPPQSKLSPEELDKQLEEEAITRKQKEQALREKQQAEMKEKERVERNRAALAREQRRIFWCNAYEQGNYVSIHSDRYKKKEKKYEYY